MEKQQQIEDINDLIKDKNKFYSIVLRTITHETFEEDEAKQILEDILDHLMYLNKKLNRNVGIIVASIDYLSNIKSIMDEPKIIEENKSEFITDTSTKDELTGLYLRDIFDVFLNKLIKDTKREHSRLSLLMIDIDDFKMVNDTYGHQKGDEVLSKVGDILNNSIRAMDFATRYGGEELSIIMPNTSSLDAFNMAERIRENISKEDFDGFNVSVSIGVSEINSKESLNLFTLYIARMSYKKTSSTIWRL